MNTQEDTAKKERKRQTQRIITNLEHLMSDDYGSPTHRLAYEDLARDLGELRRIESEEAAVNIRKATLKNGMPVTLLWSDFPMYAVMENGDEHEVLPGTVAIEHEYGVIVRRHAEIQFYIQEPWPMDDTPSGG